MREEEEEGEGRSRGTERGTRPRASSRAPCLSPIRLACRVINATLLKRIYPACSRSHGETYGRPLALAKPWWLINRSN